MTGDQLREELEKRLTAELIEHPPCTSSEAVRLAIGFLVDYVAELTTRVEVLEAVAKTPKEPKVAEESAGNE